MDSTALREIAPERRSAGIGSALFRYAQEQVGHEAACITLSVVSKNYRALLRFCGWAWSCGAPDCSSAYRQKGREL